MKHRKFYVTILFTILLFAVIFIVSGCSGMYGGINTDVPDKFIESIEAMDFEKAHECFWKYGDYVNLETYIEDCNYIVEKLGVTSIDISDDDIVQNGDTSTFQYNVTLHTKDAGDITSSCEVDIIVKDGKTFLSYSSDMLLEDFEHNDVITRVTLSGSRGEIFTSDGEVIAQNTYADTVYMSVEEDLDFKSVITQVDGVLDLSEDELSKIKKDYESAVKNNYGAVKIKVFSKGSLDEETIQKLENIEYVSIDSEQMTYQRYYPFKNVYSHVVGYANSPNDEQSKTLEEGGYSSASVWGKEGIEKSYNEQMLAKDGYAYQLRKDTYEIKRVLYTKEPEDGKDVILSIDSQLQQQAYDLLYENLDDDQAGTVIVMNAETGAVEAQACAPNFDPNLFSFGISEKDYKELINDKSAPLYNRATQGLYPPGSTLKPFTAIAALDAGTASFSSVFPYAIVNNGWTPKNWHWLPVKRDKYVAPPIDMKKAMVYSDNIYFAWLGLEMGYDNLANYLTKIGIGETMSYDLPTAKSNLINEDAEKNGTMLADMSFGHGQLLVTPLQMASMYSAFINDGDMVNPYLVQSFGEGTGENYTTTNVNERKIWKEDVVSSSYIATFNDMFKDVVQEGTGTLLKGTGTTVYCKTGTAIKGDEKDKRISWVVGWWPDGEEKRLVVVVIETPVNKGNVKFAIAKPLLTPEKSENIDSDNTN